MTVDVTEQGIHQELERLSNVIDTQESVISELVLRMEDTGWVKLTDLDPEAGITLKAIKSLAKQAQDSIIANPIIGRATRIRGAYVWSQGFEIIEDKKTDVAAKAVKAIRQNSTVFRRADQAALEQEATASGNIFFLVSGTGRGGRVRTIPIAQIAGAIYHPDPIDGVMMFIREWTVTENGKDKTLKRAYLVGRSTYRGKSVKVGQDEVVVDRTARIVHLKFNVPSNWTFGVPELYGADFWAKAYKRAMESDLSVKEALARFVWKVQGTKAGSTSQAASRVADTRGVGGVAAMTEGANLTAINKSGADLEFNRNWPLAAIISAGFDVPLPELLYQAGATDTNTLSETNAHVLGIRQEMWCEALELCFELMNVPVNMVMPHLFAEPVHRVVQAVAVMAATNTVHPKEIREAMVLQLKRYGVQSFEDVLPEPGAWAEFTQGLADNPGTSPLNTPNDSNDTSRSPAGALADGDNEMRDEK